MSHSISLFQVYRGDQERLPYTLNVEFDEIRFVDHRLTTNWYKGNNVVSLIKIVAHRLDAIHAFSFNEEALNWLTFVELHIRTGAVHICSDAFNYCQYLSIIRFNSRSVTMNTDLFKSHASILMEIYYEIWPNDINLNDMFGDAIYRQMQLLKIANVEGESGKFRILTAANFTSFRRLEYIILNNCGIEVIDGQVFDGIMETLQFIDLYGNRIKHIDLNTFRRAFEANGFDGVRIEVTECTCQMLEFNIMLCPFSFRRPKCPRCWSWEEFNVTACGIRHREVHLWKLRNVLNIDQVMRIISVRMTWKDDAVFIATNFTNVIRVIIVNLDVESTQGKRCKERVAAMNFKCFQVNHSIERLSLDRIHEIHNADIVSITAIPILYHFGARPMHTMTVRQDKPLIWIDGIDLMLIAALVCFWSTIVVFIGVVCLTQLTTGMIVSNDCVDSESAVATTTASIEES